MKYLKNVIKKGLDVGNVQEVSNMLSTKPQMAKIVDEQGNSLLHRALRVNEKGHSSISKSKAWAHNKANLAQMLVETFGADVLHTNTDGLSAIQMSFESEEDEYGGDEYHQYGHDAWCEQIAARNAMRKVLADVKLLLACRHGRADLALQWIKYFSDSGAYEWIGKNGLRKTALDFAAEPHVFSMPNMRDVVSALLYRYAAPKLNQLIRNHDTDGVNAFLHRYPSVISCCLPVTKSGKTPLATAATENHADIVRLLLDFLADCYSGYSLSHEDIQLGFVSCAKHGQVEVIEILVEHLKLAGNVGVLAQGSQSVLLEAALCAVDYGVDTKVQRKSYIALLIFEALNRHSLLNEQLVSQHLLPSPESDGIEELEFLSTILNF